MYVEWFLRWGEGPEFAYDLAATGGLQRYLGSRVLPLFVYRDQIRRRVGAQALAWLRPQPPTPPGAPSSPPGVTTVAVAADARPTPQQGSRARWEKAIEDGLHAPMVDPTRTTSVGVEAIRLDLVRYRPGGNAVRALERTLDRCRASGIEPILVAVPLPSSHRNCYSAEIEAAFGAFVAQISHQYRCRYFDYRELLPDHFFVDYQHAAADGAAIYSQKMALEVVAPAWELNLEAGRHPQAAR
jgi:hypothetical protein